MNEQSGTQRSATSEKPTRADRSVLDIEAERVDKMMNAGSGSEDGGDDHESALTKAERAVQNEQESCVRKTAAEVKDTGAGSNEPAKDLNKDG